MLLWSVLILLVGVAMGVFAALRLTGTRQAEWFEKSLIVATVGFLCCFVAAIGEAARQVMSLAGWFQP